MAELMDGSLHTGRLRTHLVLSWVCAGIGVLLALFGTTVLAALFAAVAIFLRQPVGDFAPPLSVLVGRNPLATALLLMYLLTVCGLALLNMEHIYRNKLLKLATIVAFLIPFVATYAWHEVRVFRTLGAPGNRGLTEDSED